MEALFEKADIYKNQEYNSDLVKKDGINELKKIILLSAEDFEKNKELLDKILPAIGFEPAGSIILDNSGPHTFPLYQLLPQPEQHQIIAFGVSPAELSLPPHLKQHVLYEFEKLSICFTTKIQEMSTNQDAKKSFWGFAKKALVPQNN